jgi:hypothetical protein
MSSSPSRLELIALCPLAIVDHVATLPSEQAIKALLPAGDEVAGSKRITPQDLTHILAQVRTDEGHRHGVLHIPLQANVVLEKVDSISINL